MPRSLSALDVIVGTAIAVVAVLRQPEPSHVNERVKSINPVDRVASTMPPGNNDSGCEMIKK
jgi:hypothetical protein